MIMSNINNNKVANVAQKVDNVKLLMHENIHVALQNCEKLEAVEAKSEEVQQLAGIFKRSATDLKNKMWWKNMKMKLTFGFIFLVVLGIITGIIVAYTKQNERA
jgi:vesicle-associated membrane protein 4